MEVASVPGMWYWKERSALCTLDDLAVWLLWKVVGGGGVVVGRKMTMLLQIKYSPVRSSRDVIICVQELPTLFDFPTWSVKSNPLTPLVVSAAASKEIKNGVRISLDWPHIKSTYPGNGREPLNEARHRLKRPTMFLSSTQCSSQWDGLPS